MTADRSAFRNTRFYDATNPEVVLGGFRQNGSITEANFLSIIEILIVTEGKPVCVQARISGHVVTANNKPLVAADYDIYCDYPIQISDEPWIQRLSSSSSPGKETRFCDDIRARDKKCVISGFANSDFQVQLGMWGGFEAAHIFPSEQERHWIQSEYGRWITDMDNDARSTKIHSAQNGFLVNSAIRQLFDQYLISINPDDGFKVVAFDPDIRGLDGRILDPVCRNPADPHCVSHQLLRWHFRHSVLANVRGLGEPIFEHDFPPGTDMVGEILVGPKGKERFELEISSRLSGLY
ncbi:hypothetical protein HOY82DRAFT_544825 [Tuber indicum]|nr:hypothetical protein HOY82DRAFT_544825 [Tuber indicum]